MVTITVHCPHCQSDALVRNGHAPDGKQLYRCCACGRQSRENPTPSPILELDKLWSFVLKKAHESWIWIALCRKTRQVVAYALGDRSKKTCQQLWEAIPDNYREGHYFTDFWVAYRAVIPEEQHTAVGKETGETAHVERWNNTLRQRLARFVRMTLSFSKSVIMHEACLLLFLHRYNRERAILLK